MALLHEDARRPKPAGYVVKSARGRIRFTVAARCRHASEGAKKGSKKSARIAHELPSDETTI
jgi:hypothetical protein